MKDNIQKIMSTLQKIVFKNDAYMRRRGKPVLLVMFCAGCKTYIMSYQKDGPGPLLRCYLDRIHHPETLYSRQHDVFDKSTFPKLECPECCAVIGTPMMYEKEDRPAYHLRLGSFSLKKIKQ